MLSEIAGDVMITIMEYLSLRDLASLAETCRSLYILVSIMSGGTIYVTHVLQVEELGWKNYLRLYPRPFFSYTHSFMSWNARDQVR